MFLGIFFYPCTGINVVCFMRVDSFSNFLDFSSMSLCKYGIENFGGTCLSSQNLPEALLSRVVAAHTLRCGLDLSPEHPAWDSVAPGTRYVPLHACSFPSPSPSVRCIAGYQASLCVSPSDSGTEGSQPSPAQEACVSWPCLWGLLLFQLVLAHLPSLGH